jgi:hypothetical protein
MASEVLKRNLKGFLRTGVLLWWMLITLVGIAIAIASAWVVAQIPTLDVTSVEA